MWLLAAYLTIWTFLSGGIIDRYARQRPTRAHGFFSASGRLVFRLARLTAIAGVLYWFLFAYVHPWLFLDLFRDLTRGLGVERTAFAWRVGFYLLFGIVLLKANLIFDYARIRLVGGDRRRALGALRASIRFLWHHPLHVTALYALDGLGFLLLLAVWSVAAPGVYGTGLSMWLAFAAGQLYLFARLAIKLLFLASHDALFQSHRARARPWRARRRRARHRRGRRGGPADGDHQAHERRQRRTCPSALRGDREREPRTRHDATPHCGRTTADERSGRSEPGDLARVHPAHVQLRRAVPVRGKHDALAVRRPARRGVAVVARGERAVVRAVEAYDPQVRVPAVGHDVGELADVDHSPAVGRDLRVSRILDIEYIHHRQSLRAVAGRRRDAEGEGETDCE
jgi:hypothetical protein